jgi:hypothetical protein
MCESLGISLLSRGQWGSKFGPLFDLLYMYTVLACLLRPRSSFSIKTLEEHAISLSNGIMCKVAVGDSKCFSYKPAETGIPRVLLVQSPRN